MTTEAIIKNYVTAEGHPATNLWIVHEGRRYYSRVNYAMQDTPGTRAYCVSQFHERQRIYARD